MESMATTPQQNGGAALKNVCFKSDESSSATVIPGIEYSIFTPFAGFHSALGSEIWVPRSRDQELQLVIENVKEQQVAVRNNIAAIYEIRAYDVVEMAKRETKAMVGDYGTYGDDPLENEKRQRAADAMFKRCMVDRKVYEQKLATDAEAPGLIIDSPSKRNKANVEMGGTEKTTKPTTVRGTNQKLSADLKVLVDDSVKELESYDNHARGIVAYYEKKLKDEHLQQTTLNISRIAPLSRRTTPPLFDSSRPEPPRTTPPHFEASPSKPPRTTPPRFEASPSKPRIAPLPVGRKESAIESARRLSGTTMPSGMPIVGGSVVPKKRMHESIADMRRG